MRLPTKQECDLIVSKNNTFKSKEETIEGRKVVQYSYLLAKHCDFINPLGDNSLSAEWLRGITFVEQEDGSFKRYPMLPKFFNLHQIEENLYHNVKDKTISIVQEKMDGSMITFLPIGDVVLPKTKFSFFNEQARMASDLYYSDEKLRSFVDQCIFNDWYPIFELTSPKNRIVLPYSDTKLTLLQVVNNNGDLLDIYSDSINDLCEILSIDRTERKSYTLDELIELADVLEWKEGWVVQFTDGHIIKIKTKHYFEQHRLMTGDINVEHKIIEMTLNETIDDVLSQIPEDAFELRQFVNTISDGISEYVDSRVDDIMDEYNNIMEYFTTKDLVWEKKEFVDTVKFCCNEYFKEMMFLYDKGSDIEQFEKFVIEDTIKKTNALEKARAFLRELGVETEYKPVIED